MHRSNQGLAAGLTTVILLLSGCAPGRDLSQLAAFRDTSYRLGGGDQVRLITFGEDQLTGDFRVDDQGSIALPLVGQVHAAGLTPAQLSASIATDLKQHNLLQNPSVSAEVATYRPIFVLGEVAKPGQYPYQPGMTMLTTVAIAGGFTYRGFQDYARVVRTTNNTAVEGKVTPLSFIAPGDVVSIFERHF